VQGLIIFGSSTGGTRLLPEILKRLPVLRSAVVVAQHMPEFISGSFARTLSRYSQMPVRLASAEEELRAGEVFLIPGGRHGVLERNRSLRLTDGPKVNYGRPAVAVTMRSVVKPEPGQRLAAVLLTGMGQDGVEGMAHVKALGGRTIAQDEASCAVFGMPRAAISRGVVDEVLTPLQMVGVLADY